MSPLTDGLKFIKDNTLLICSLGALTKLLELD